MRSVAIIGAGAAGLCMGRYLRANRGLFNFVIYEKGREIGGTWVYDEKTPSLEHGLAGIEALRSNREIHSSMYKSLRTNLPKQLMEYPDFKFPKEKRSFISHREVLEYLRGYSDEFGLTKHIRLSNSVVDVKAVQRNENSTDVKWKVSAIAQNSDSPSEDEFDSVIVCNGHFTKPDIPDIAGISNFKGSVLHSHMYRVADGYEDKTVLVLGGSSSGRDIAMEISQCAKHVVLSHRGEFGMCELPSNIQEQPPIKMIVDDGSVVLTNGARFSVDSIVFCTGYLYEFPFLHESCGITVSQNRVTPLYKQIFNINNPSMAFIGVPSIACPFHLFSMQARWIVKVLNGIESLPSKEEMLNDAAEEFKSSLEAGIPEKYFHRYDKGSNLEYFKNVSKFSKVASFKTVLEKMFVKAKEEREQNLMHYRDKEYVIENDEEFKIISE